MKINKKDCVNGCIEGQVSVTVPCPECQDENSVFIHDAALQMLEALQTIDTGLDGLKKILPPMTQENKAIFEIVLDGGGLIVKKAIATALNREVKNV